MEEANKSIFTMIIEGKIPSHKVFENDQVIAFLDINPFSSGHTLVVPKEPARTLNDLSDESAEALGRVLPRISRAVLSATGAKEFNVLQNNGSNAYQSVPHVHFHIIPKFKDGSGLTLGSSVTKPLKNKDGTTLAGLISELLE